MNFLEVDRLKKYFPKESGIFRRTTGFVNAVDDISFSLEKGKVLGLVGESGSGKSTVARLITRLIGKDSGNIGIEGKPVENFSNIKLASKVQIIFQDPFSSLNPKLSVGTIIGEAIKVKFQVSGFRFQEKEIVEETKEILNSVGISTNSLNNYSHQFSGGQRQRIAIARALAVRPEFIIADEPVSSLDVSVAAQIINLFVELKERFNLTYLFISHDLNLINYISDYVAVMLRGKIVEYGKVNEIYNSPKDNYTKFLLSSCPKVKKITFGDN